MILFVMELVIVVKEKIVQRLKSNDEVSWRQITLNYSVFIG